MPILKLRKHQAAFSDEDILINPSDFNGLKLNDVVELKPPKGGNSTNRILLQVRRWPETNSYPGSVSIKDSIVITHLQLYSDVLVNVVDKKDVLVDSIEICFSNAYLARSYMWGLRNHLNNKCVYQRQKLDYLHIRSQICEIWAQGNKLSSGYVDDDTKIVFRSASSLVYLFIQMSSEMWDYDINGDLYCEKAINGFLKDLFDMWRKNDCSHDITIILFSRTFYDAESIEEFPSEMRECLQVDYKNRFYEDCYRVAFQNDRFDLHDWNAKLTTLKLLFNQYQKEVIDRHQDKYSTKIPRAYNSSASQGNFLEVLNMSLNVFEKHYFDRSFDRTGQLSVVVSPGVGVFEVDFEMTNLTKQRIIDNGIGSDLVCLGEQPLHTVPLLKFNSKSSQVDYDNLTTCDVYNMPHWINLSFYSSQTQVCYSNFVPRIKLPTLHSNSLTKDSSRTNVLGDQTSQNTADTIKANPSNEQRHGKTECNNVILSEDVNKEYQQNIHPKRHSTATNGHQFNSHSTIPDLVDYDDYDSQVFKANSMITYNYHHHQPLVRGDGAMLSNLDPNTDNLNSDHEYDFPDNRNNRNKMSNIQRRSSDVKSYQEYSRNMKRQISENLPIHQSRVSPQFQSTFARLSLVDSYLSDIKIKPESADDLSVRGYNVQSSRINRSMARPKALINPFDPSHTTIKLTPNRRRWTHVFPQGPTGTFIQQHHYQPVPQKSALPYLADVSACTIPEEECSSPMLQTSIVENLARPRTSNGKAQPPLDRTRRIHSLPINNAKPVTAQNSVSTSYKSALVSNDTIRFAWCASGEQEWTPAITTGVDWKSLTMPACLPLTTDFFPSKTSLQNDYVIGEYNIDSSCIHSRYTLIEVYRELVCQRLQKGFQIILLPRQSSAPSMSPQKTSRHKTSATSSHRNQQSSGAKGQIPNESFEVEKERTEYTMSIGRIFHKLSLNGNTITVTQYRPRHPYPTIKIDYCYRFRAPFHETYGQSWVHFKSEKLENYSWNYLDNYICARGESFELRSSLKFWRFRVLILPSRLSLRKISDEAVENNITNKHDLYHLDFDKEERDTLMDSFIKLLEIINKTRRASACRLSNVSSGPTITNQINAQVAINSTKASQPLSSSHCSPNRLNVQISTSMQNPIIKTSPSCDSLESKTDSKLDLHFESINMDIDSALRDAKRAEWVHVQYHNYYDPSHAFELVIKWMVASGAGVAEMVQGWSRKAGNSKVHVVPIPWEPFAMPHSGKADPLRCPIGIPLRLDSLPGGSSLDDRQVICFQEKILRRYGFVRFYDLISTEDIERQYVHMSGFAFVALPNVVNEPSDLQRLSPPQLSSAANSAQFLTSVQESMQSIGKENANSGDGKSSPGIVASSATSKVRGSSNRTIPSLKLVHQETISSPHEEYITRHIGGTRQNKATRLGGENEHIEFIWSWNYMLTKRWRSNATQDESYAVSLMQDFKYFCQNSDDRLLNFWLEVKGTL